MSKNNNILGVSKFELGAIGDGIMGAALTEFTDIEVNSIVIDGEQATEETIPTEADPAYLTVNAEQTPAKLKVRLFGVALSDYPMLMGGTFTTDHWDAPKSKPNIYLSGKLTGLPVGTNQRTIEIPYGKVNARVQGNLTKNGLPAIDLEITANTPISALAVEGAPYTITDVAV